MLILITDKCNLACKHCMHSCSSKNNSVMSLKLFAETLKIAGNLGASTINIAGGEPTTVSCDELQNFLAIPLFKGYSVILETNGNFLDDAKMIDMLEGMAELYPNTFFIQISAFKEYYTNRHKTMSLLESEQLKTLRYIMGSRLSVVDESNSRIMLSVVGRSSEGEMLEEARLHNRFPSCINSALLARQKNFLGVPCGVFETYMRFCTPMVDSHGGVHLGESIFCKEVCNISDGLERIREEIQNFKPCGKCHNYHWHFDNPTTEKEREVFELIK